MEDNSKKFTRNASLGLITGTLLLGLGIYALITRPDGGKALPVFMVVYGLFRLGFSGYTMYKRKQNEANEENNESSIS